MWPHPMLIFHIPQERNRIRQERKMQRNKYQKSPKNRKKKAIKFDKDVDSDDADGVK